MKGYGTGRRELTAVEFAIGGKWLQLLNEVTPRSATADFFNKIVRERVIGRVRNIFAPPPIADTAADMR
jgi:hypothetical protein